MSLQEVEADIPVGMDEDATTAAMSAAAETPKQLEELKEDVPLRVAIKEELKTIVQIIWPIVLTVVLSMLQGVVVVIFVGQSSSTVVLGAVGIAVSYLNVFGVSIGYGLATACDTLCSQAYGGTNKKMVGLVIQRGILILSLALFPCWAIWLSAEPILLALKQDPEVSRLTGRYCTIATMMLPAVYIYILAQKFLQAQNIVRPLFVIGAVANVCTIAIGYVSVVVLKHGLEGAAVTHVCSQWLLALLSLAYLYYDRKRFEETWPAWSFACLYEWDKFVRLAIPGMLMLSLEWWTFEICQFFAGVMGDTFLAVQLIVIQIASFSFMVPLGLGIAASIRVGNLLGSNDPKGARRAALICLGLILCTSSTSMIIMYAAHAGLPRIWTEDAEVVRETSRVLLLVAVFQLVDHTQGVFSGILRGIGLQRIGATFNFIGYYVFAIPIALVCAFHLDMNVLGLWIGLVFGGVTQVIAFSIILFCRTNWAKEAEKAIARSHGPVHVDKDTIIEPKTGFTKLESMELTELHSAAEEDPDEVAAGNGSSKYSELEVNGAELPEPPTDDEMIDVEDTKNLLNPKTAKKDASAGVGKLAIGNLPLSRGLLVRRGAALLVMVLILVAGLGVKIGLPSPIACRYLPSVANATHICNSFTSLLAGGTCGVQCASPHVAQGVFSCSANGTLVSVPTCILK